MYSEIEPQFDCDGHWDGEREMVSNIQSDWKTNSNKTFNKKTKTKTKTN
jgi:hypothetical protein